MTVAFFRRGTSLVLRTYQRYEPVIHISGVDPRGSGFAEMECSEFLALSSEFRDGRTREVEARDMEAHLASCPGCRQYRDALEKGVGFLRALPSLEVPEDFKPRLSHRIYHMEDSAGLARETLGSGATTLSVMAVALVLALAAWAPRAGTVVPSVELPALVVGAPRARIFTSAPQWSTFSRDPSFFTTADFQDGPWGDTHQLLFEYSSLSERRRGLALTRVGIQ